MSNHNAYREHLSEDSALHDLCNYYYVAYMHESFEYLQKT